MAAGPAWTRALQGTWTEATCEMPTIFLDCDGVLADFDRGATRILGMPPRAFERRFGLKRFWARLASEPDFYNTVDLLPDAMELFEAVRSKDDLILTGPPRGA